MSGNQKTLDRSQERNNVRGGTFNRNSTYSTVRNSQAAAKPVEQTQPDFPTNALLYFNINSPKKSIAKSGYHTVTKNDLKKMNLYSGSIQQSAKWYLENLADARVTYFYQDEGQAKSLQVDFLKRNFMHLSGILPVARGQTAEQSVEDLAYGRGKFDNILVSNAITSKLQVLPLLAEIVDAKAFVFDDLSEIEKFGRMNVDKAIKTEDADLLVAFRSEDGVAFPATLLKLNESLSLQLSERADEKVILGVVREKLGKLTPLSINEDYVKDGGQAFIDALQGLKNKKFHVSTPKNKFEERLQRAEQAKKEQSKQGKSQTISKSSPNFKKI